MNHSQLDKVQNVLDRMVNRQFVTGANCLVYQNGMEQGYYEAGFSDRETGRRMSRDTICHMYSMSKPITSAAVMMLLEDGCIDLADPVSLYIPEFGDPHVCISGSVVPASCEVTIQDLLNMTSGYTYGGTANDSERQTVVLIEEILTRLSGDHPVTTMEVAQRLGRIPLAFEPGSDYQYGFSADILGAVVEVVSGMRFSDFLQTRLFGPLGMRDTGFFISKKNHCRLAQLYKGTAAGLEVYTNPRLGILHNPVVRPAFESGGAGLFSTIDDYMTFCRMLLNEGSFDGRQILHSGTVRFMRSSCLKDSLRLRFESKMPHLAGYNYGNLMRILVDPARAKSFGGGGEYGWDGWLGTYMLVDPANDLALVFMQQRTDCGTTGYTRRIRNVVYAAV